ncbi:F0F1 ATP synthase subunit A [Pirellulaceae bacterium SH467]|jgi:F-type H+-transporting ATPase subunit a
MASDILHIKDGYYFELPKFMWRSSREKAADFPKWMVRLDSGFQSEEADAIIAGLKDMGVSDGDLATLKEDWQHWQHESAGNHSWPLDAYLEKQAAIVVSRAKNWAKTKAPSAVDGVKAYLAENPQPKIEWFIDLQSDEATASKWQALKASINSDAVVSKFVSEGAGKDWSSEKIAEYNQSLHGKVLIPQPFAQLRNAYEVESGFGISRYMIIEVLVAIVVLFIFRWLAKRVSTTEAPKGKAWNLLEGFVQAVRNNVVVPAMGEHDADKFMPFFWSLFFFILGCNLAGMIPWVGAPTASFGTTFALALIVFIVGVAMGIKTFGVVGYLKNICPSMGLPIYLAVFIVPLIWIIEFASLFIKHGVLAVRLLMNMGAGHLVLLGILGIGISLPVASSLSTPAWMGVAGISVFGTTLLSVMELFVAFLQAYVFTFLAALFVGSAMHHH